MHSEYLRSLYLDNDLAKGRYAVSGEPIALLDLRVPMFVVGTERDHVSPWRSVYKVHQLTDTDLTFLLSSGGHNVGIVNPPGVEGRYYRMRAYNPNSNHLSADEWLASTTRKRGSWWPEWSRWLAARSTSGAAPPAEGALLGPAPGAYVMAA